MLLLSWLSSSRRCVRCRWCCVCSVGVDAALGVGAVVDAMAGDNICYDLMLVVGAASVLVSLALVLQLRAIDVSVAASVALMYAVVECVRAPSCCTAARCVFFYMIGFSSLAFFFKLSGLFVVHELFLPALDPLRRRPRHKYAKHALAPTGLMPLPICLGISHASAP